MTVTNNLPSNEAEHLKIPILLHLVPERHIIKENIEIDDEDWIVRQNVVSHHPCNASDESVISAVWQVSSLDTSRQRIAVYAGPLTIGTKVNDRYCSRSLHVSFQLPDHANAPMTENSSMSSSIALVWTVFPEMHPSHQVLCCLVTPNSLCIWDVYPESSVDAGNTGAGVLPSEGWTVTLPFECRAIFQIPGEGGGLFLQRLEDIDDRTVMANVSEDDGFFLHAPPSTFQRPATNSIPSMMDQQLQMHAAVSSSVPSLFSLHHPLDDVLPVVESIRSSAYANSIPSQTSHSLQGPASITDVFEQLLWVGTIHWIESTLSCKDDGMMRTNHSAVLAVTYHTILCRHAVWKVGDAPGSPEPPPLHEIIRMQYHCKMSSGILDDHNDLIVMEDLEILHEPRSPLGKPYRPTKVGGRPLSNGAPKLSRVEALADALGVSRTPRKSLDVPKVRYRGSDHPPLQQSTNFFSPSNSSPENLHNRSGSEYIPPTSASTAAHIGETSNYSTTNMNYGENAFSTPCITSRSALTCIFMEQNDSSSVAENVFVASNLETSCKLILCLVCKRKGLATRNGHPKELKLYALQPDLSSKYKTEMNNSSTIVVQPCKESLGCVAAQPIEALPIAPCYGDRRAKNFKGSSISARATDILILDKHGLLSLYRSYVLITTCTLSDSNSVIDLMNPARDELTFRLKNGKFEDSYARGKLSLVLEKNSFSERILSALDSCLYWNETNTSLNSVISSTPNVSSASFLKVLALKMRADCCRFAQSLAQMPTSPNKEQKRLHTYAFEDMTFSALRTILISITELELSLQKAPGGNIVSYTPRNDDDTDWLNLLDSDFHYLYSMENNCFLCSNIGSLNELSIQRDKENNSLASRLNKIRSLSIHQLQRPRSKVFPENNIIGRLFDAIHFLYEESKLFVSNPCSDRFQLVWLLVDMCNLVKASDITWASLVESYIEYYRQELGNDIFKNRMVIPTGPKTCKKKTSSGIPFTSFSTPPSIYGWLDGALSGSTEKMESSGYSFQKVSSVNAACTRTIAVIRIFENFQKATNRAGNSEKLDLDIITALIEEGLNKLSIIRDELPPGISLPILEVLFRCRNNSLCSQFADWSSETWSLIGRNDISRNTENRSDPSFHRYDDGASRKENDSRIDKECDGLEALQKDSAMLFPDDNRIREASRLLRSSRPIFLRVPRAVEVSDHEYERIKQERLLLLCLRSLSLPIGRGMLTIGSLHPVPAETLPIPELCLKGKVPPTNATLNLDTSECPPDIRVWPDFHNGVAAGLRLPLESDSKKTGFKINRTWIVYNRPPSSRTQAEEVGDAVNQQSLQRDYSHGGFLLALGLRGHLKALEMSDIYDYLTHGTVTTTVGVLLGLAANKRGSCDISVSKMLCLHIPSLIPQHFSAIDVASTVQTAAVIGAGLLFQKSSHRMMTEFLLNEIGKRPNSDVSTFDREAYTLACGLALGTVNLAIGDKTANIERATGIADLRIDERLYRYIIGGIDSEENKRTRESNDRFSLPSSSGNENDKCSTIFEGDQINTDMTAPGATLALGLIFMKTGNRTIAASLVLPDTHFLLEFVRPDFLGLRVISRALILWNDVQPTKMWIEQQVPTVIREAYNEMRNVAKTAFGGSVSFGKSRQKPDYDRRAVRQIYTHVIAGACFGMGLRYAGTGDKKAKEALYACIVDLHVLREANDPISLASRPELPILETCLSCAAISLAMVLAGTGDLDALRLFKVLRWRCDKSSKVGSHMIYGMAIGLLFLGGGSCTLGREPSDIACLVIAFFPRFPMTTSDNQCHLQAFRHLYALAVKSKEIRAIDVDTGKSVHVPVDLWIHGQSQAQRLTLPVLLRNSDNVISELLVVSDQYYPLKVDVSSLDCSLRLFVKQRDTNRIHYLKLGANNQRENELLLYNPSSSLTIFASYFYGSRIKNKCTYFNHLSLLECLAEDTEECLQIYLFLMHSLANLQRYESNASILLWNICLIRTYYGQRSNFTGLSSKPLLNSELLLPYLQECIEQIALHSHDLSQSEQKETRKSVM